MNATGMGGAHCHIHTMESNTNDYVEEKTLDDLEIDEYPLVICFRISFPLTNCTDHSNEFRNIKFRLMRKIGHIVFIK